MAERRTQEQLSRSGIQREIIGDEQQLGQDLGCQQRPGVDPRAPAVVDHAPGPDEADGLVQLAQAQHEVVVRELDELAGRPGYDVQQARVHQVIHDAADDVHASHEARVRAWSLRSSSAPGKNAYHLELPARLEPLELFDEPPVQNLLRHALVTVGIGERRRSRRA
jgi:hypothetical protein